MKEGRYLILEYKTPIPKELKVIMNRALKITFEGCDIEWITDTKIKIKNMGITEITIREC